MPGYSDTQGTGSQLLAWDGPAIPKPIEDAITRFVVDRIRPGSFVSAILENDLRDAVARVAHPYKSDFVTICEYVAYCVPSAAWGSPKNVEEWLRKGTEKLSEGTVQHSKAHSGFNH